MIHQEIIDRLKSGNERFIADQKSHAKHNSAVRNQLIEGQQPFAIILSCADSRVVPEYIFDAGLGELFVVRVAGNIANQSSIASIEYAVAHLNTTLIVVMGHQNCGAVNAAIQNADSSKHIVHLIDHIKPAMNLSNEVQNSTEVIKQNAISSAKELKEKSKIIRDAVEQNVLEIRSAYYHLDSGAVTFID